jgi:MoaA/NifB/PqqE/SkfB family radical SAM enzyme
MPKLIEIKNNKNRLLRLQYDLGNLCNYTCWYCFPGSNDGDVPFPNIEVVKYNLVKLINHYTDSNLVDEVQLNFMGGEPTLWKHLGELVEYVSKNAKCSISMQTNGSRTLRWWKEFGKYFDHVSISVHHEKANTAHIIQVADILIDQKVSILTSVLMDHTAWDKCKTLVDELVESKMKFMILAKPIHINGVVTYTDEQREYLKKSVKRRPSLRILLRHINLYSRIPSIKAIFDNKSVVKVTSDHYFILNLLNRFTGWDCTLGINFLYISRNGLLTGTCGQKLYKLDYFYNINDVDFIEKFNPILQNVTCEQKMCLCAGETLIPKRIIKIEKYEN